MEIIPIELLKRPDPILFFEEVVLFESELDDNGISILSCKLRVMPDRMLLLCRQFMRLDDVLIRVRDTRIYVDFNRGKIIRDYTEREDGFDKVKKVQLLSYIFMLFNIIPSISAVINQPSISIQLLSVGWGLEECSHSHLRLSLPLKALV